MYMDILMQNDLTRGDYRDCAVVMLQLLDVVPPGGVKWYKPPGTHNARWMGNITYTGKMYAFSEQLEIEQEQLDLYERFCTFNALYYVPHWLSSSKGIDAPVNDLAFWNDMQTLKKVDKPIADAALASMENHMWYTSEELSPLAMFSDKVSASEKTKMAKRILKYRREHIETCLLCSLVVQILKQPTSQLYHLVHLLPVFHHCCILWRDKVLLYLGASYIIK